MRKVTHTMCPAIYTVVTKLATGWQKGKEISYFIMESIHVQWLNFD